MLFDHKGVDINKRVYINPNVLSNDNESGSDIRPLRHRINYYKGFTKKLTIKHISIKLRILATSKHRPRQGGAL